MSNDPNSTHRMVDRMVRTQLDLMVLATKLRVLPSLRNRQWEGKVSINVHSHNPARSTEDEAKTKLENKAGHRQASSSQVMISAAAPGRTTQRVAQMFRK